MYNQGFTLIEMVIVLTILAILGAAGLVLYSSTVTETRSTATSSVGYALSAVSAGNYMMKRTGGSYTAIANCNQVSTLLPSSRGLPSGYTTNSQAVNADTSVSCAVTNSDGVTQAVFMAMGA